MIKIPKEDKVNPKFYSEPDYRDQSFTIGRVIRRVSLDQCPHCDEWMSGDQMFCGWCLAVSLGFHGWDEYGLLFYETTTTPTENS